MALVLCAGRDGLETLFIKRATRDGDPWSGQIALPGGKRDSANEPLMQTAMRETHEEVGIDLSAAGTLLGELDELRPRTPVLPPVIVRPYVFAVETQPSLVLSHEVADAFWVPLRELYDPTRRREVTIQYAGLRITRPAIGIGEHVIWGMTEHILRTFEELMR